MNTVVVTGCFELYHFCEIQYIAVFGIFKGWKIVTLKDSLHH